MLSSFVAGPPLVVPSSPDNISATTRIITDVYSGIPIAKSGIPGRSSGYVDIRDVARLVVFAVEHPEKANNERFIAASAYALPQGVADILRKAYPERASIIEEGTPGEGYLADHSFPRDGHVYDGSKAVRVTGQGYIPWEKTVLDTVEKLKAIL
jgi:nucleoside-diphosphate-sugar epimerase